MKNLENVNKISTLKEIQPDAVEDDFDPTENGEASEKTHRASYEAQLGHQSHLQHRKYILFTKMPPSRPSQSHHKLPCQRRCTRAQVLHDGAEKLKTRMEVICIVFFCVS